MRLSSPAWPLFRKPLKVQSVMVSESSSLLMVIYIGGPSSSSDELAIKVQLTRVMYLTRSE